MGTDTASKHPGGHEGRTYLSTAVCAASGDRRHPEFAATMAALGVVGPASEPWPAEPRLRWPEFLGVTADGAVVHRGRVPGAGAFVETISLARAWEIELGYRVLSAGMSGRRRTHPQDAERIAMAARAAMDAGLAPERVAAVIGSTMDFAAMAMAATFQR